jgi:hypothetical protein
VVQRAGRTHDDGRHGSLLASRAFGAIVGVVGRGGRGEQPDVSPAVGVVVCEEAL